MTEKRKVKLVVISDVHLGTIGCHATELCQYLKSINPEVLILNGDILDIWQFKKRYWPISHMRVIKHIFKMLQNGTRIHYITGNHDEMLRKFSGFNLGNLSIENKLTLNLNGKKAWFFHGDIFDVCMKHSRWLAKLGAKGYDLLILINRFVNYLSQKFGKGRISLSARIKQGVKSAVKFIDDFEETAITLAMDNGYDFVVCGHIHQPQIRIIKGEEKNITYLNSGDWVENLTALEYNRGKWKLHKHELLFGSQKPEIEDEELLKAGDLFNDMLKEFGIKAPVNL